MGDEPTNGSPAAQRAPRLTAPRELVQITMQEHDSVAVATIAGEVDISNVNDVAAALTSVSNLALGLVVDLRKVDYLDSAGVSLLHDLAGRLHQRSQRLIVVCPPDAPPHHVLELTALNARTLVLDDLAPAIDALLDTSGD
jgi:anti-anti-sigma factor